MSSQQHSNTNLPDQPSKVHIKKSDNRFELYRNNKPFTILGVGGTSDLKQLKELGANSIRTWDAEGIEPLLNEAHELGLAVVVGIWLEHGRHGFDYNEPHNKEEQLARVRTFATQFKDHPALLAWGVGNEVELGSSLEQAINQINDAARIIKSIDPHHPTMAVIAEIGEDKAIRIQQECPDIDMLGINSYGGLGNLAKRIKEQGVTMPYAITEFGPLGHWETGQTPWGAPYEQTSSEKARFVKQNYLKTIQPNLNEQCLGSFAFLWGYKQEKTATWYGLRLESGETTESVDVLSKLWTGNPVDNHAPRVRRIRINGEPGNLKAQQELIVSIHADDPDQDSLHYEWTILPESQVVSAGGDHEDSIDKADYTILNQSDNQCSFKLPMTPGPYRIFVVVRDGQGHAGTANLPIMIKE